MSSTPAAQKTVIVDHHGHSIVYVAMTSTLYTVICIALIVLLLVILGLLIYYYCYRVRKSYNKVYNTNTVRYSQTPSDQSEDEKSLRKKSMVKRAKFRASSSGGKGHDASPSYSQSGSTLWPTVPVNPHIDISAGHLLLEYIERNLKDQYKLSKEWEGLQDYTPESVSTLVANRPENKPKNRYIEAVPYDHNRVALARVDSDGSDYINASFIVDTDPAHPKYIATQGPQERTLIHFWQMLWEQNVSVIVMLTTLTDMGLSQCYQYWPTSGVACYGHYEVRLVSEHPHSSDYIIRSFYIKNTKAQESRTVTHFQFLSWTSVTAPSSAMPLLEFRRKVNKAHQSQNPLLVHCNGGVGRTGTYILIDMALSRIEKGAKELNLAATVEHLRDQRPNMVRTKAQFEFTVTALVEETGAMLNVSTQQRQKH